MEDSNHKSRAGQPQGAASQKKTPRGDVKAIVGNAESVWNPSPILAPDLSAEGGNLLRPVLVDRRINPNVVVVRHFIEKAAMPREMQQAHARRFRFAVKEPNVAL